MRNSHARDFDTWAEMGADGWGYADVLPYYKRLEDWHDGGHGGDASWRGRGGPLHVTRGSRSNPLTRAFVEAGTEWLHLVDLNGAFAGEPVNAAAVEAILSQTKTPAQLGGGIRDMATIERWLDKGLARVILGTVAASAEETTVTSIPEMSSLSPGFGTVTCALARSSRHVSKAARRFDRNSDVQPPWSYHWRTGRISDNGTAPPTRSPW